MAYMYLLIILLFSLWIDFNAETDKGFKFS